MPVPPTSRVPCSVSSSRQRKWGPPASIQRSPIVSEPLRGTRIAAADRHEASAISAPRLKDFRACRGRKGYSARSPVNAGQHRLPSPWQLHSTRTRRTAIEAGDVRLRLAMKQLGGHVASASEVLHPTRIGSARPTGAMFGGALDAGLKGMVRCAPLGVWCSGQTRCPVKAETAGSNPVIPATASGAPGRSLFATLPSCAHVQAT